jgi:exonuclease SbcD
MRLLHTSDWHLGRTIRGQSRQAEFERAVLCVVDIARREQVDAVLIAGDTFETFSPPAEAEHLLYEALTALLRDNIKVAMIAGNHDNATRMDALAGILRIAGADCVGSVPRDDAYAPLRITSRDGSEAATVVALPWVAERIAVEYEHLFGEVSEALGRYAGQMERAISYFCRSFDPTTANIFMGHMLIDGASIGEGSGERKMQIGQNFAVPASCLPGTAQYVALGHVHRSQEIASAAPAFYAGSLLQLDFGESGQEKSVNLIDVQPRQTARVQRIPVEGGRELKTLRLRLEDLPAHAGQYADAHLRVYVDLDAPVLSLYERVREVLPNALHVEGVVAAGMTAGDTPAAGSGALAPHELLARYYAERHEGHAIPEGLIKLFNDLYQAEVERASA